jgi:hypothetical protein
MKKITKIISSIVIVTFLLASCQIEKRHYTSGYNVKWFGSKNHSVAKNNSTSPTHDSQIKPVKAVEQSQLTSSNPNENSSLKTKELNSTTASASNQDAPVVFSAIEKIKVNQGDDAKVDQDQLSQSSENSKVAKKPAAPASGGKSQLIALLLVIFVGTLGIHRFYLGYIWQGVVQLLTAGGCGIWALIDLIRIITGDLKPKDDEYETKL